MVRQVNLKAEKIRVDIGKQCNKRRVTLKYLRENKDNPDDPEENIAHRVPGLEDYKEDPTPIYQALNGMFYYI